MTNALDKTRTELAVEKIDYNVGLKEDAFSRRELEGAAQVSALARRSSLALALTRCPPFIVARRRRVRAARQHHAHRQRHHRLVREGRSGLSRLRAVPGGVRRQPHADHRAEGRLRRPAVLAADARLHPPGDRRHRARRHRRARGQPGDGDDRRRHARPASAAEAAEGGIDVRRLIEPGGSQTPDDVRRRAMKDDLIRGDLVSDGGAVTAIVVSFDEDRIDDVRGGVIQRIHDIVDPGLPPGVKAYYNGSLEISETYNRITLANQRTFTPPIFLVTLAGGLPVFRSWRKTLLTIVAVGISVLWTLGLFSLMGFSYNVLSSMLDSADRRARHRRRRAHHAALGRGAAPQVRGGTRSRRPSRTWRRRCSAPARRPRSACCRSPRATSSPSGRSASARRSGSWSTS